MFQYIHVFCSNYMTAYLNITVSETWTFAKTTECKQENEGKQKTQQTPNIMRTRGCPVRFSSYFMYRLILWSPNNVFTIWILKWPKWGLCQTFQMTTGAESHSCTQQVRSFLLRRGSLKQMLPLHVDRSAGSRCVWGGGWVSSTWWAS